MRLIDKIIIHCSATPPSMDLDISVVDKWLKARGWKGCGYHLFIKRDGLIQIGRPIADVGAHCIGANKTSIGVCYAGGVDDNNKPEDNRTSEQKESLLTTLKYLKKIFPSAEVWGHRDFSTKACPSFDAKKEYSSL